MPRDAVDKLLKQASRKRSINLLYFPARLAELRGHGEAARAFYRRCLKLDDEMEKLNYISAWARYAAMGENPYAAVWPGSPAAKQFQGAASQPRDAAPTAAEDDADGPPSAPY